MKVNCIFAVINQNVKWSQKNPSCQTKATALCDVKMRFFYSLHKFLNLQHFADYLNISFVCLMWFDIKNYLRGWFRIVNMTWLSGEGKFPHERGNLWIILLTWYIHVRINKQKEPERLCVCVWGERVIKRIVIVNAKIRNYNRNRFWFWCCAVTENSDVK